MTFWDIAAAIGAGVILLGGAATALTDIAKVPGRVYRWLRRAIHAVDVISSIPERLEANEKLLADHLKVAAPQVRLLEQMARDLGVVVEEVKNNGGGSLKDSTHRIEVALGLPKPKRTPPTTAPTTVQEPA